jgi:hypothetical protein
MNTMTGYTRTDDKRFYYGPASLRPGTCLQYLSRGGRAELCKLYVDDDDAARTMIEQIRDAEAATRPVVIDPDGVLRILRDRLSLMRTSAEYDDYTVAASEAAEAGAALDAWLSAGGALPADWQRA